MTKFIKIRKWAEANGYSHDYNEKRPPYTGKPQRIKIQVSEDLYFVVGMKKSTVPPKHPHGHTGEKGGLYLGENEPVPKVYQYSQGLAILNMERAIENYQKNIT
jgi:hypothetical protein